MTQRNVKMYDRMHEYFLNLRVFLIITRSRRQLKNFLFAHLIRNLCYRLRIFKCQHHSYWK